MLELPKPPPHRRVWFLVVAAVVVAVVAIVAGAALGWQQQQPVDRGRHAAVPSATLAQDWTGGTQPETTSLSPTTAKPGSGVLWQQSGSDTDFGSSFDAPKSWRIVWSFSCQNLTRYGGGNFKLTGEGDFENVLIQRFAVKASGTERMTSGGHGRLVVESVCDRWTVRAIAP